MNFVVSVLPAPDSPGKVAVIGLGFLEQLAWEVVVEVVRKKATRWNQFGN